MTGSGVPIPFGDPVFDDLPDPVAPPDGIGSHHSTVADTDEWLTPPHVLDALGPFDLDPCSPVRRPWPTATRHLTVLDDGLARPWAGRVWLNPPYGPATGRWLARLAAHGRGTALVFARTETETFARHVWPRASALLFLEGRLTFHRVDGTPGAGNGGAPSVLVAYGPEDAGRLRSSGLPGALVEHVTVLGSAPQPGLWEPSP